MLFVSKYKPFNFKIVKQNDKSQIRNGAVKLGRFPLTLRRRQRCRETVTLMERLVTS